MNKTLLEKPVKELTTLQLRDAYERRLVEDGLASLERGEGIEVTPAYFEELRQLARETASKK